MLLRRILVAALVLGFAMAYGATGHVTLGLVASTTLVWMPVIALQIAIALLFIAGPARSTVGVVPALARFFGAHTPWSLYFLLVWMWVPSLVSHPLTPMLLLAVVPLAATAWMIARFFKDVLSLSPRAALVRTVLHQAVTWGSLVGLFGGAVAIWPRILEWVS